MESELQEGYKMTELGALPEEWDVKRVGDALELKGGSTPSTNEDEYWNGTIPWAVPTDITKLKSKYIMETSRKITNEGLSNCSATLLPKGSILLTSRATIGFLAINELEMATNQGFINILPTDNISNLFMYYYLSHIKSKFVLQASGSTFLELSKSAFKKFTIPLPPLPEQRRIATILSTLDETVEHTEALIEKYKNIKAGLMSDLLTRGIDVGGRIRSEGTHRFKDSTLGRVPEELEVVSLGNYAKMMVPMRDKPKDLSGPIPWTRIEDFHGKYLYGSINNRGVNEETVGQMNLKVYPINTVLCSCSCSMGVCAITKNELISNQTFIGIVASNKLFYEFLYYLMTSYSEKLKKMSTGTTIDYLPRQKFEDLQIPLPPLQEQRRIAEILTAADQRIEKEEAYRDKLLQLKKGLMQDLLTGKVRVKDGSAQMAEQSEN